MRVPNRARSRPAYRRNHHSRRSLLSCQSRTRVSSRLSPRGRIRECRSFRPSARIRASRAKSKMDLRRRRNLHRRIHRHRQIGGGLRNRDRRTPRSSNRTDRSKMTAISPRNCRSECVPYSQARDSQGLPIHLLVKRAPQIYDLSPRIRDLMPTREPRSAKKMRTLNCWPASGGSAHSNFSRRHRARN